ncbi:phage head-tail connector protein [Sporolactobacillus shoreicorticis]|uniref:Phage head-tail connector protein n=1 Tax=Sporolactobacillus shoreicorticis TaxID=1923877 RepID=A0ABW5S5U4_9BACL|nr:phage head-tail connector protein [Sporolactobacillus shoreicorticis]MCO7127811.1 phage head-tail connector protein [Sporolactobacillus shoreicorticis]
MSDPNSYMALTELKDRLGIGEEDTSQDKKLQTDLDDAVAEACDWCHRDFYDSDGNLAMPASVKKGIALMIQINQSANPADAAIISESIGGMSQSFSDDPTTRYGRVYALWKPYRKVRFI